MRGSGANAIACNVWRGILLSHLACRQLPQLIVDQGQKLLGVGRVALLDGTEDASDVGHGHGFWKVEIGM